MKTLNLRETLSLILEKIEENKSLAKGAKSNFFKGFFQGMIQTGQATEENISHAKWLFEI